MTPDRAASMVAIAILVVVSTTNAAENSKSSDSESQEKLWSLIDSMGQKMPLTKASFKEVLGAPTFDRSDQDSEGAAIISEPIVLSSDLGVSDLDLQLDKSGQFQYAGLTVHGICIRYKEVKDRYGPLIIVDTPKGHTPFDDTLAQSRQPWGSYYFVFLDIATDCLHRVTFSSRREEGI